jgi:hypothetical protein
VAHHYTEARCSEQAVGYWQQAGARAVLRHGPTTVEPGCTGGT